MSPVLVNHSIIERSAIIDWSPVEAAEGAKNVEALLLKERPCASQPVPRGGRGSSRRPGEVSPSWSPRSAGEAGVLVL